MMTAASTSLGLLLRFVGSPHVVRLHLMIYVDIALTLMVRRLLLFPRQVEANVLLLALSLQTIDAAAGSDVVEEWLVLLADGHRDGRSGSFLLILLVACRVAIIRAVGGRPENLPSLQLEVVTILHEAHFLEENVSVLATQAFFSKETSRSRLQLLVGSLNLVDVDLLLLVHLGEPLVHELLLGLWHAAKRVEELTIPHDGRVHDDLVDECVRRVD